MFLVFQIDQGNLIMMFTNFTSLKRRSMWWKTLILFLQMSNLRVKKLLLYVFEDNAVIKMIIKRRSPEMRQVSRTHRVALVWLFDQLADILTKGNYSLLCCNGEANSTRIRRRTSHSKIKTYDEFNCEDAIGRVDFNFIKSGEDMVRISRSLEICCGRWSIGETWELVTTRLFKIGLWSILVFSRVEKWGYRARSIREIWENFLGYDATSSPSSWRTSSRRKCAFRKVRRDNSWWIGANW